MKVFVSWSGSDAERIAVVVTEWIPLLFPTVKPWVSSKEIGAGQRSMAQFEKGLNDAEFGIICVTPSNQEAPWLNFEAGSISNALGGITRVAPLLTGFTTPAALRGPLGLFQASLSDRDGFLSIATSINEALLEGARTAEGLKRVFDALWPDLDAELTPLRQVVENSKSTQEVAKPEDLDSQMLEEILLGMRALQRQYDRNRVTPTPRYPGRSSTPDRWKAKDELSDFADSLPDDAGAVIYGFATEALGRNVILAVEVAPSPSGYDVGIRVTHNPAPVLRKKLSDLIRRTYPQVSSVRFRHTITDEDELSKE